MQEHALEHHPMDGPGVRRDLAPALTIWTMAFAPLFMLVLWATEVDRFGFGPPATIMIVGPISTAGFAIGALRRRHLWASPAGIVAGWLLAVASAWWIAFSIATVAPDFGDYPGTDAIDVAGIVVVDESESAEPLTGSVMDMARLFLIDPTPACPDAAPSCVHALILDQPWIVSSPRPDRFPDVSVNGAELSFWMAGRNTAVCRGLAAPAPEIGRFDTADLGSDGGTSAPDRWMLRIENC